MRMLRQPAVLDLMAMGRTKFDKDYIKSGRARWIYSGRLKRMPEDVVNRLIAEDIASAESARPPPPAISRRREEAGQPPRRRLRRLAVTAGRS